LIWTDGWVDFLKDHHGDTEEKRDTEVFDFIKTNLTTGPCAEHAVRTSPRRKISKTPSLLQGERVGVRG
jgi:hypothetical protein